MDKTSRRTYILDQLRQSGEVNVETLSEQLDTSEVTIRKDLSELELAGLAVRRHGGAVILPSELSSPNQDKKLSKRKIAIARAAAQLLRDHNRVIVDSGSTTAALIPEIGRRRGMVVMTNSLAVASALLELENEPTLLMTGGTWDKRSDSFQGSQAESVLRHYDFDQLYTGADGIDLERGTCTYNELLGLSRSMAEVAREVIVLAESAKLSRKIPNLELAWSEIDVLVTDPDLPADQRSAIEAKGVRVVIANE